MLAVMRIFLDPIIEGLIRTFWTVVVAGAINRRKPHRCQLPTIQK